MAKPIKKLELTDTQKEVVRALWDKEDLVTVAQRAFDLPALESHSPETKAVHAYIATLGAPIATAPKKTRPPAKGPVVLTEAQRVNIAALLSRENPPTVREITLMMFPDIVDLSSLHGEYKAVYAAVRDINEEAVSIWDEPVENRRYRPPISYPAMIGAINRHVGNPYDPTRALYDAANMKSQHERNIKALLSYMKTQRFVLSASLYDKKADRDLFESNFINLTYDKASDLIPEDVDMYISAAIETVEISKFQRDIIRYERVINDYMDGDLDGEKRSNLSKPFVDALTALRQKAGESKKRHKDLLESVAQSRGKRTEDRSGQNDSLLNLINMWMEEKTRNDLIALAKKEHEEDEKEFGRIADLDDAIALMAGMTKGEASRGL